MKNEIREALDDFTVTNGVKTKGSLSVVIQLTRAFMSDTMPSMGHTTVFINEHL